MVCAISSLFAQKPSDIIERPEPKRLLNDIAGLLDEPKRTEALEYKLNKLNDSLGVEIFIVTIKSLKNIDVKTYATQLADNWEDENDKENGIFILVDFQDRGYAIIPGSKYKAQFSDVIIRKVEASYIIPHFKKKQYYEGLNAAVDAIANHITGKLTDTELKTDDKYSIYPITICIFLFFLIFFPIYQYNQFKKHHFGTKKINFISAFMLMSHLRPSNSSFEDFKKGTGEFSLGKDKDTIISNYGGGAGGSWGGW